MSRYKLEDVYNIKTDLHKFMHDLKKAKRINDRLAGGRFLKSLKRDLDDYLRNQGWLIKGK